jgi:hypothetical protein
MKTKLVPLPTRSGGLLFLARLVLMVFLLLVAGFSAFGFLATFEPGPAEVMWAWRVGYGVLHLGAWAGMVGLFKKRI